MHDAVFPFFSTRFSPFLSRPRPPNSTTQCTQAKDTIPFAEPVIVLAIGGAENKYTAQ